MRQRRFKWASLGVVVSMFFVSGHAQALRSHKVKSGDNLNSLAIKYHVSIKDIAKANKLSETSVLSLGKTLTIPDPPKSVKVAEELRKAAKSGGDNVKVRMGPGTGYRLIAMTYKGDPVTVTAKRDGWVQVTLNGGKSGWMREELLDSGKRSGGAPQKEASNTPKKPGKKKFAPVHALAEDRRSKNRRTARRKVHGGIVVARKSHEKQHPKRVARHRDGGRHHTEHIREARRHSQRAERFARWSRRRHYIAEATAPAASNDIVRTAYAYRGTPYVWGGSARGGFDCSGFTSYLYRKQGVSLPHSASGQFQHGHHVAKGELKPGDLVFFHTVTRGISHVGMYVGNGKFVHASSRRSGGVRVDSLNSGYYNSAFRGARRIK